MVRISRTMTIGAPIQARTASYSAPLIMTSEMANHTTSGMRATAVSRCAHQWCTPCLAEPRPRARARGVLKSLIMDASSHQPEAYDPRHQRGDQRHAHHDPATAVGILELEAIAGIPEQMPDAVAQMIEAREQPTA